MAQTVQHELGELFRHPLRFFGTKWNWKTAVWSGVTRAPIFLVAAWSFGPREALTAGAFGFLYRFVTAGYSGAIVQALRDARPHWLAVMFLMAILPGTLLGLEALVHWIAETPNLDKGMTASAIMTSVAVLFNLYAMRRGAFLASGEGASFVEDTRRIPALIAGFAAWPIRLLLRKDKADSA